MADLDKQRISHEGSMGVGIGWLAAAIFFSAVMLLNNFEKRVDCALNIRPACVEIEQEYIVNE